jgi:hypothetical protein
MTDAKKRCTNSKHKKFADWGGRGIRFNFKSIEEAARWVYKNLGPKPSPKHSIDRYPNNDGHYEPGNLRWATAKEQVANARPRRKRNG